jgi:hypothetical protein
VMLIRFRMAKKCWILKDNPVRATDQRPSWGLYTPVLASSFRQIALST